MSLARIPSSTLQAAAQARENKTGTDRTWLKSYQPGWIASTQVVVVMIMVMVMVVMMAMVMVVMVKGQWGRCLGLWCKDWPGSGEGIIGLMGFCMEGWTGGEGSQGVTSLSSTLIF